MKMATLSIVVSDANLVVTTNQKNKSTFTTTTTVNQNAKDANGTPTSTVPKTSAK